MISIVNCMGYYVLIGRNKAFLLQQICHPFHLVSFAAFVILILLLFSFAVLVCICITWTKVYVTRINVNKHKITSLVLQLLFLLADMEVEIIHCFSCGSRQSKWRYYIKKYQCDECMSKPEFRTICKTNAMKKYRLTHEQIEMAVINKQLQVFVAKNPYSGNYPVQSRYKCPPMKLYYEVEVAKFASTVSIQSPDSVRLDQPDDANIVKTFDIDVETDHSDKTENTNNSEDTKDTKDTKDTEDDKDDKDDNMNAIENEESRTVDLLME